MPTWFNEFIHRYQDRAFRSLTEGISFSEARVLDIGTGVGRWARWYAAWPNADVHGIDIEPQRLERARALISGVTLRHMGADAIGYPDRYFDAINCITVLQHVPDAVKRAAIAEIGRVAAPSSRLVIMELIDEADDASHVFPWPAAKWQTAFAEQGFRATRRVGNEYIPLLRLLKRAQRKVQGSSAASDFEAIKQGRRSIKDRATLAGLRVAVAASYPLEELAVRFAPPSTARINGWLFERGPA
jgi:ubiquinone/menaquinone biosynthesis C-methylase UbiE